MLTAMIGLVSKSHRRYGGYIVHLGIVVMFLGFAGEGYKPSEARRAPSAFATRGAAARLPCVQGAPRVADADTDGRSARGRFATCRVVQRPPPPLPGSRVLPPSFPSPRSNNPTAALDTN